MDQGHLKGIKKAIEWHLTGEQIHSELLNGDVPVMVIGSQSHGVLQAQCGKGHHPFPYPHSPSQGSWGWPMLEAEKRARYSFVRTGGKILKIGGNPQVRLFNLGLTPSPSPRRHDTCLSHWPLTFRIKMPLIPNTSELVKLFQTADIFLALTKLLHWAAKPD